MATAAATQPQVEYAYLSDLLQAFKQQLEQDAGAPLHTFTVNPALLLYDLCEFLEMSRANEIRILGLQSLEYVHRFKATHIKVTRVH